MDEIIPELRTYMNLTLAAIICSVALMVAYYLLRHRARRRQQAQAEQQMELELRLKAAQPPKSEEAPAKTDDASRPRP